MASTGLTSPTANSEDYTAWSIPDNVYVSDDTFSSSVLDGDMNDWYNFSFSIPAGSTIDGIIVSIEGRDVVADAETLVELSWNGGTNYTTSGKTTGNMTGTDTTYTLGGATDTWGRTWTDTEFSNTNFRVRFEGNAIGGGGRAAVDFFQVNVFYTVPSSGHSLAIMGVGK